MFLKLLNTHMKAEVNPFWFQKGCLREQSKMIWPKSIISLTHSLTEQWSKPDCVEMIMITIRIKSVRNVAAVCAGREKRRHLPTSQELVSHSWSPPTAMVPRSLDAWINTSRREITRTSVIKPASQTAPQQPVCATVKSPCRRWKPWFFDAFTRTFSPLFKTAFNWTANIFG